MFWKGKPKTKLNIIKNSRTISFYIKFVVIDFKSEDKT